MDQLCVRCARISLQHGTRIGRSQHKFVLRSFSTSTEHGEDSKPSSSSSATPPNVLRATRPPRNHNTPRTYIPRQQSGNPSARPPQGQRAGGGQLLQRSRPSKLGQQGRAGGGTGRPNAAGDKRNTVLVRVRYADGSEAEVPAQQLLRPGRGFREPEAVLGTREEIMDQINGVEARTEEAQETETVERGIEVEPTDAEINEYISKHIDRPANPTEPIAYEPSPRSTHELQKDWPDTPLSSTGLTATVIQKIELLAKRIPHGYQTPEQIAAHFEKGNLTRFESEEEKQQVLKIAQAIAQKRADKLTERKGEQIEAADMSLSDLSKGNDTTTLIDTMVRGNYGDAEKQRMPLLDSIVRNLRNNSTYHQPEMAKFMAKIEGLIPAQSGNKKPTPKRAQG